jgi:hypothetical protein
MRAYRPPISPTSETCMKQVLGALGHQAHRNTHPRFTSTSTILTGLHCALSTASPLLIHLAWDVLIPGCAAVESANA